MTERAVLLETVLGELRAMGEPWALLQGETAVERSLAGGGDLDIAAASPAAALVERLGRRRQPGLHVIALDHYDIGRGDAFWCVGGGGQGLHVDVLCDPRGVGRLAVPTALALRSVSGSGLSTVSGAWQLAYLVSKRLDKGQWDRLEQLAGVSVPAGADEALGAVFGPQAAEQVGLLLQGRASAARWRSSSGTLRRARQRQRWRRGGGPALVAALHAQRAWGRVRRPVGFWVHVVGPGAEEVAQRVGEAVGGTLVRRACRQDPTWRDAAAIGAVVLRPGLVVTHGEAPHWPRAVGPQLVLNPGDHDLAKERVVEAMSARVRRRAGAA